MFAVIGTLAALEHRRPQVGGPLREVARRDARAIVLRHIATAHPPDPVIRRTVRWIWWPASGKETSALSAMKAESCSIARNTNEAPPLTGNVRNMAPIHDPRRSARTTPVAATMASGSGTGARQAAATASATTPGRVRPVHAPSSLESGGWLPRWAPSKKVPR